MLFYRAKDGETERSVGFVRTVSIASLISYPAGAITLAVGPDTAASSIGGFSLIVASLFCVAVLMRTDLQRIVGEEAIRLDEYERQLRYRAISVAYALVTALALVAIIYAAIASDKGYWVPHTYEQYNGLFWGVFLYASVAPTACLAWMVDPSAEQAS